MKTQSIISLFLFTVMTTFGQTKEDALKKQENNLKTDTVNIDLKSLSTQLINLRDSIGVEMMAMDKRLMHSAEPTKINIEKAKCSLSIYRSELDKLIEELTMADISYITETKKRSFRAVMDIRREFHKILALSKETAKG
ncbi:MAG TPA: hypothetical protein VIT44_01990 [Cyclobacteriaceae bacterium]